MEKKWINKLCFSKYNVGLVLTNRTKKSQIFSLWPLCFLRNIHVFGCTFLVFCIPKSSDSNIARLIACFRRLDGSDGTRRSPRSSSYLKRATDSWKKNRSFLPRVIEPRGKLGRGPLESIRHTFSLFFFIEHWKKNWSWYLKRNISWTSRMTRNMTSCWARECSPADLASQITWVE